MSTTTEHEFSAALRYGYANWNLVLKLRHHRGHRSVETVGWEVVELSIEKLPEDEGDERPQPRFTFSFPVRESIHDVRRWLKHHRDDRTIKHLYYGELSADDLDSENAWLLTMIALDQWLTRLPTDNSSTEED